MHNIGHNDLYLIMKDAEGNELVLLPKDRHMYSIGKKLYQHLKHSRNNFVPTERVDKFLLKYPISTEHFVGEVCLHRHQEIIIPPEIYITGLILPIFIPVYNRMLNSSVQENNSYHITFFTKGGEINLHQQGSSTEFIGKTLIYVIGILNPDVEFSQAPDSRNTPSISLKLKF